MGGGSTPMGLPVLSSTAYPPSLNQGLALRAAGLGGGQCAFPMAVASTPSMQSTAAPVTTMGAAMDSGGHVQPITRSEQDVGGTKRPRG